MKIAIVTNGKLPMPSVNGGGVETLVDTILSVNENKCLLKIDVYSVYDNEAERKSKNYSESKFIYYRHQNDSVKLKIKRYAKRILWGERTYPEPVSFSKIKRDISKEKYDLIIIENTLQPLSGLINKFGQKVILHLHNDWINSSLDIKYQNRIAKLINKSAGIITISEYMKKRILTVAEIKKEKVVVIKNCCDNKFRINDNVSFNGREFKKKLNIDSQDFVIIFCGRLVDEKGVLELMKAVKKLDFKYKLIVAGEIEYEQKYSQKLLEEARKNNRIIMLDYVQHSELYKYYSIADIAVVPSKWEEPAGLVVIESLEMNVPLITTRVGGIPEYVYGNNYIMCDTKCLEEQLESAIKIARDKIEKGEKIGNNEMPNDKPYGGEGYYDKFVEVIGDFIYK